MVLFPPITYKEIIEKHPEIEQEINELAEAKNDSLKLVIFSTAISFTLLGYFIRGFFS